MCVCTVALLAVCTGPCVKMIAFYFCTAHGNAFFFLFNFFPLYGGGVRNNLTKKTMKIKME